MTQNVLGFDANKLSLNVKNIKLNNVYQKNVKRNSSFQYVVCLRSISDLLLGDFRECLYQTLNTIKILPKRALIRTISKVPKIMHTNILLKNCK